MAGKFWTPKVHLFISIIVLILVVIPRFNYYDPGIVKKFATIPYDATAYQEYANYFKGNESLADSLSKPFTYRILTPYLASRLPYSPLTSINIINVVFLILTVIILYFILKHLKFEENLIFLGCLLFSFSFPTFYYSVTGLVDPAVIFFITLGILFILKNKWALFSITLVAGILAKESIVVIFPFLAFYLFYNDKVNIKKKYWLLIGNFIGIMIIYLLIRSLVVGNKELNWIPTLEKFLDNIVRVRAYIAFILSFGLPGILVMLFLIKNRTNPKKKIEITFLAGFYTSLAVFIYSFFSAYTDGRFIWLTYPFAIPLSLFYIQDQIKLGKYKLVNRFLKVSPY